ncbi:probable ATP-dependent RNA helicase YTHDC2 isoform X3 [Oryzias latipes]|uniref:probable ATP-dependent RNA helicase YTHDC2 isoform X3 n=1 Tax=Oryzias latipes TaxID=8090 RepID=UPI000CE250EB|nr:probable ATP-dependent RNA helicase YTHDC2 isoform X3 [Oryzias latipes]
MSARSHGSVLHGDSFRGSVEAYIDEEVKIAVTAALERFYCSEEKEVEFPPSLSPAERSYVQQLAQNLGFISRNTGKEPNRLLVVGKRDVFKKCPPTYPLIVSQNSKHIIQSLLQRSTANKKEQTDKQLWNKSDFSTIDSDSCYDRNRASGRLNNGIPMVPRKRSSSELDNFRSTLPVWESRVEILQLIQQNRVVLILGETGSGKTTQIPQFLLDDCSSSSQCCRIFCTQPRRSAAIAVAERVAAERGESVGQTVGYHVRLESRVSPKTLLTYCTSGVLLRTLMAGDASLSTVTHVIVDEVHERDGVTDFLLTKIKDVLKKIPSLKLILSSASLDVDLFRQYFGSCPVISLKETQFEVKELFLEDILKLTGFHEWCGAVKQKAVGEEQNDVSSPDFLHVRGRGAADSGAFNQTGEKTRLQRQIDACISKLFFYEDQEIFCQLFSLILNEGVDVDCSHSETGATPLMMSAARGFVTQMQQLLSIGADLNKRESNGWTALDFAKHFHQTEAIDLLQCCKYLQVETTAEESILIPSDYVEPNNDEEDLLKLFHHSFDGQWGDLKLIMTLLHHICSTSSDDVSIPGAVLIFLPGYEEIVALREHILNEDKMFCTHPESYQVLILHSDVHTLDRKMAVKPSPPGIRKIILSSNIGETSITINDVVFVIDSGRVKEKYFDAVSHTSTLKMSWISKASVLQRKGRAGRCRPGYCFHLFSRLRFRDMLEFPVPQLLLMPLQGLCLQTKLLAPSSCLIGDFLSKAPQPPPARSVSSAVQVLKIDALEQNEDLTELGYRLADLPVEPQLGKMVLCGVVLKCLDPILTIVCALAYRDPFIIPTENSQKRSALNCRKRFASNSFSDHMALLRAFQAWQKARSDGWERTFCEKNFLSQATMDIILGMRTQLLGHLRAIGFVRARGGSDIRDVNLNSENWAVVKAALVTGIYPNLIKVNKKSSLLSSLMEKKVHFHSTSVLSQQPNKEDSPAENGPAFPTDWLIYDQMSRGHRMASVRCCSLVTSVTVAIFGGCARLPCSASYDNAALKTKDDRDIELAEMKVDEGLVFHLEKESAGLLFEFRQKWQKLFAKRIRCPSKPWSQQDEDVLGTLVSVLGVEEQKAGLQQPTGIGQRPKPMSSEEVLKMSVMTAKNSREATVNITRVSNGLKSLACCPMTHSDLKMKAKCREDTQSSSGSVCPVTPDSPSSISWTESSEKQTLKPGLMLPVFSSVRYFIMKSSNMRNLEISRQKEIWSTSPSNENKLTKAFHCNSFVILIFSVQGSGHFQGYARMTSAVHMENCQDWGFVGLGGVFSVEWIHKESISFQCTQHILNPWNDNKKVQISRDGQELEPQTGHQLLMLWDRNFEEGFLPSTVQALV